MPLRRFSPRRLTTLRKQAGLSREDLARAIDGSFWTVRSWERGNSAPSAQALAALADALGCTIDDLFEDAAA